MPKRAKMYIGGKWIAGSSYFKVHHPYDGSLVGEVPKATDEDIERALQAAEEGFQLNLKLPAHKRAEILEKTALLIKERKEEIAKTITWDNAKPIRASRAEVDRAFQTFKFSAEEAKRLHGEIIALDAAPGGEGRFAYTIRLPLGVIAAITPFNFPFNLVAHKVAPAIAAGNSVVLKPASATPHPALLLAQLLEEAGLPPGILNVITGRGDKIGDRLCADARIQMITFTGSAEVGERITEKAKMKKIALELGSNSAVIVDDDARLDYAVLRVTEGGYGYQGQSCISVQRVYVRNKISDRFLEKLVQGVEKLKLGDPFNEETDISAVITPQDRDRILAWIKEAEQLGAKVLTGGEAVGNIIKPTVVMGLKPEMKLSCKEVFGPVVGVTQYHDFAEALKLANDPYYGLQGGVFTQDISKAFKAIEEYDVGGLMINDVPTFRIDHMPYGGFKYSGLGTKEGPRYAIEEMTKVKLVVFKI